MKAVTVGQQEAGGGVTLSRWYQPTWNSESFGLLAQDSAGQGQAVGSVQASRWGPWGGNTEAGGMWKCRQVVGVGKRQGWGGWRRAQEEGGGWELAPWGTSPRWEGHLGRARRE